MRHLSVCIALVVLFISSSLLAQEASRQDFDEFCRKFEGRWIGEVTWVADWPGLGKKGDKATCYFDIRLTADGNALLGNFYGGSGSGIWMNVYDAGAQRIKSTFVSSGGVVDNLSYYKTKDGQWNETGHGSLADGTKTDYKGTIESKNNGSTLIFEGSGHVGGKSVDDRHDVWRRAHK